jgi:hypothetical protein
MVRNYVRKTNRQEWSVDAMEKAVQTVISGEMGFLRASNQFNVPKSTLERYVNKRKKTDDHIVDKTAGKFKNVFSTEQELELVEYLKTMESRLFGLTQKDLRSLAFELAERNNISNTFNRDSGLAGQDWVKGFLARHSTLSIRTPENTSGARAMGFNKVSVDQFFSLLTQTIYTHKLTPDKIFNVDETGVSVNPKTQSKIVALKGKRQVGSLTSAERGETVTAAVCMSASGLFMPPMLIFPRMKKKQEFELGLPPGGWAEAHSSGWMTADLFLVWFEKFIKFSKATRESPTLLIVDGHSTHTKNLQLIDMARENGVILLCLPPHTSHKLQPLDVSFFKPLSLYYSNEIRKWLRSNPSKVVTLFQISSIFGASFLNAATMTTAINGFKSTGIWPLDPNIFSEMDFQPAATTDIQLVDEELELDKSSEKNDMNSSSAFQRSAEPAAKKSKPDEDSNVQPSPGCSWMVQDTPSMMVSGQKASSAFQTSPEALVPIPLIKKNVNRTNRKRGKTAILTESPYKNELKEAMTKKEDKEKEKERKKIEKDHKNFKSVAKILFKQKDKSENTHKKINPKKEENRKKRKMEKKMSMRKTGLEANNDDEAECLYCGGLYSASKEGWVACQVCFQWAHNSCAGMDSDEDEDILTCEYCK